MKKTTKRIIAAVMALFYVLGIGMAIDAVMTSRTAPGAIAWAASLVTVPFVAVPAYAIFGRSKFEGQLEAYLERKHEIDELIAESRANLEPFTVGEEGEYPEYDAIRKLAGMEMTRGNRVELLIDGDATFDSILDGISRAEDYVLVQFYMIHDDGLGRRLQQALIERAKAGVRVYLLYDKLGSKGLPEEYADQLRSAGAQVSDFRQEQGSRWQLNFRNHRKMVVVDGITGWVGGHNVGDEYLGLDPEFTPWRDTHVKLEGPVVTELQATIVGDWYWATRELPELNWEPTAVEGSDVAAMIIPSAPTQRLETAGLMFVNALNSAQHRIWISAPYFVPDEAVMKALELAALRGVDVRILTPGKGDSLPVYLAAFHYMAQLRDLGIQFYAFKPGFLHEKVMLVDDHVSTVGTANFDNRSFRLNFEVTALIIDEAFGKQMEAMFERDFQHAEIIDLDSLEEKPFLWRLGVTLSRLAAPVL
jgi:cardiolipin synthase